MPAHATETAVRTLPSQPMPVDPPAVVVIDHVRAHAVACWWDFTECRWVCG